jgi:uncharacterized protein (DUF433 family)
MVGTERLAESYRPQQVARLLGIQPQTLRVWSNEFAEFLSDRARRVAASGARPGHRAYTEADLRALTRVRQLLRNYASYAWVRRQLREEAQAQGDRDVPAANWTWLILAPPAVRDGKPAVRGTGLKVAFLLERLAAGATTDELLEQHRSLTPQALRAVFGYAAHVVNGSPPPAPRPRRTLDSR